MTAGEDVSTTARVTDLLVPGPAGVGSAPDPDDAGSVAWSVAALAGVDVREVSDLGDLAAVQRLFESIWRREQDSPVSAEMLRALAASGNYVAGAFEGRELVAACVGFFAAPAAASLHSHIAGVAPAAGGRQVGFALKTHQRAWALARGASSVSWTFDPLVARNAHLNLTKLAATAVEYLPNFYGAMSDSINATDDSDRLLVRWALRSPEVSAACAGHVGAARQDAAPQRSPGAVIALGASERGAPLAGPLDARTCLVAVPSDIAALRAADPGLAREWRVAVREVLTTLLARGARITGFERAGGYLVSHEVPGAGETAGALAPTGARS